MSQNILKLKDINCFKRNNILKTITTSFTSFSTHLCYFIIAITTHIYLCELDILLMFHYNDIEIISRQCFLEILAVDKEYILMLMKDSTPEQRASRICSSVILQPF